MGVQAGLVWSSSTNSWVSPASGGGSGNNSPQPGDPDYQGQSEGEVGVGSWSGYTWTTIDRGYGTGWISTTDYNNSMGGGAGPNVPNGFWQGQPSGPDNPLGSDLFWNAQTSAWGGYDPMTASDYHAGMENGEPGSSSTTENLYWDASLHAWVLNYPPAFWDVTNALYYDGTANGEQNQYPEYGYLYWHATNNAWMDWNPLSSYYDGQPGITPSTKGKNWSKPYPWSVGQWV